MIEKLKLEQNPMSPVLETLKQVCPGAINEDGTVDFDVLKTELSDSITEGKRERYEFDWVGKENAKREYKRKIRKTLRPVVADSKNWETTKNLYIEGDNLDALKLLQKSYLRKVKMIYIDPPYNTGNDFVYCDDFAEDCKEYLDKKEVCDTDGNRLFVNKRDTGHYHSNWCNMMYPRLKMARDLLTNDGVIFISIDDHEVANLKKICDEIFGNERFVGMLIWKTKTAAKGVPTKNMLVTNHDYILVYQGKSQFRFNGEDRDVSKFSNPDNDPRGAWKADNMKSTVSTNVFSITDPNTGNVFTKNWAFSKESIDKMIAENKIIWPSSSDGTPRQKRFMNEMTNDTTPLRSLIGEFQSETATNKLKELFGGKKLFDFPKHVDLIKLLVKQATEADSLILDFFSGSATTAHAIMQLNADDAGTRKYIMVQFPEILEENSEAFKEGYTNLCEIGKERIRRAGEKIKAETPDKDLDIGFRVLRVDSSNMKDVYYKPSETSQTGLLDAVDNIKNDRTDMDLLFGVMIDCGLPLDMPIETKEVNGKKYYVVNGSDALVACFEENISEDLIREIASHKPMCAVFKDSSFAEAKDKVNVSEIFKSICGDDKALKIL
ncbi:MAG: site-specific DNA-methyltransferase [Alphaproteobacteria bacterium]|nr:site-specific DNA-methyltransferase [Alphaproteobacteria bacterium]